MICRLPPSEINAVLHVVNDAAQAYKEVIPADRWKTPYMSAEELNAEVESGVQFYGYTKGNALLGIMGIQRVRDVTLIRHAYVVTSHQRRGIGEKLLNYLMCLAETHMVLVGTWTAAWWAVRFYEKHGFKLVTTEEKDKLLREYWNIPERQVETSVVLQINLICSKHNAES